MCDCGVMGVKQTNYKEKSETEVQLKYYFL